MKHLRRTSLLAAALLPAFALAACSSATDPASPGGSGSNGGLVVYASDVILAELFADGYKEATGTQVDIVTGSSGEILGRVQGEAGNPQADIFMGSGTTGVENPELFEVYESPALTDIDPNFISDHDPTPIAMWVNAIAYNDELVEDDEAPTSYAELADPSWQGKIAMGNPVESTAAYGQLLAIHHAGGWDLVEQVARNLIVTDNQSAARAVSDGEMSIALINESGASLFKDNPHVKVTHGSEGQTAGWENVFLIADGKREEAAKQFIDWTFGPEAQALIAEEHGGLRPTGIDAPDPVDAVPAAELNVFQWPDEARADKADYLQKWEDIISNI